MGGPARHPDMTLDALPLPGLTMTGYGLVGIEEANRLLAGRHYLGSISSGVFVLGDRRDDGSLTQVQVWRHPTARLVPANWLELSRWCIATDERNAGSRFMGWVRRYLRANSKAPALVSYSELGRHDGSLYKASGWNAAPTHHALRWQADEIGYASGHGNWGNGPPRPPKMRWIIWLSKREQRSWADRQGQLL